MWDDIKIFLHVVRSGSASAAAGELKIDQSTVSRRIAQLERDLGVRLFSRTGTRLEPTAAAERLADSAERAEAELDVGIARAIGSDQASEGRVRITAVPFIIHRVLVPGLPKLIGQNPRLAPEFIATQRNLNLSRREADIALRLGRPRTGELLVRKVGRIDYGIFRHNTLDESSGWICYDETMFELPEATFLEMAAQDGAGVVLRVNDQQAMLEAAQRRLGHCILPVGLGERYPELVRIETAMPVPSRDVWVLVHPDLRNVRRIDVTIAWIVELFENINEVFAKL
ncbi:MAG: LysR family transcriptional regulator [Hyphomicrobiales bacterium]|nr:LysR family transcriptional regulator [Hyphomicrobiales bacterium]